MQKISIEQLREIFTIHQELLKIAKKLHKQDENRCNYGLSSRQEKYTEKLEKRAEELANKLGYKIYHKQDPRGGTLYLVDKRFNNSEYYKCYDVGVFVG